MAFEINEDFAKELELSEDQVSKISEFGREQFATFQKETDAKYKEESNRNAEGILDGAAKLVQEKTGIERNKGEKLGEYFERTGSSFFEEKEKALDQLKSDYEKKIEGVKDGSKLKEELETYQKRVAELEPLSGLQEKYDVVNTKYSNLKVETAFSKSMPKISENINKYEKKALLDEARKEILSKFDIEFDENNEPIAVDKENKFSVKPLKDVISENQSIKSLVDSAKEEDGKSKGFGGKGKGEKVSIDGVPFEITDKMTSEERANAIREHLSKEGVSKVSSQYAKRFAELNNKILKGLQK